MSSRHHTPRARSIRGTVLLFCACSISLLACSSEPRPAAAPDPSETAAPAPAAPAAPAPAKIAETRDPTAEELPLSEDFEDEAQQQITPDNFHAELDAIEKDMDAEK